MYLVVDLNGHTDSVAFTDAEAAAEGNGLHKTVLFNGFSEKLNYFGRALQMAGASDTNLDSHSITP